MDSLLIYILTIFLLIFLILSIKLFLIPLFFKPKLTFNESIELMKKQKLKFIDKRELNKNEKKLNPFNNKKGISFKNMYSMRTQYIIIGYSESKKEYIYFWLELTKWYVFYMKFIFELLNSQKIGKSKNIILKEINEVNVLNDLNEVYKNKTVLIKDKCPACNNSISENTSECTNCGLNLEK